MAQGAEQGADLRLVVEPNQSASRALSIDTLRGFIVLTMIFVDDLGLASTHVVPAWMRHYEGPGGMYFADVVLPAFLFIVGMSVPFALQARIDKSEPRWRTLLHIGERTASLLLLGVIIVNGLADSEKMGWSAKLWSVLTRLSAILAFSAIKVPRRWKESQTHSRVISRLSTGLRVVGLSALVMLALAFRGRDGHRIVSLSPFSVHTEWWGILGQIGWAYLTASVVYLVVGSRRPALLVTTALLYGLYVADKKGLVGFLGLSRYLEVGEMLGSQSAIAVLGVVLSTSVWRKNTIASVAQSARFALLLVVVCALAALAFQGAYGVSKDDATPSWALWSSSIMVALWLLFYLRSDARAGDAQASRIVTALSIAGQNVLLAYLLRDFIASLLPFLHFEGVYQTFASGLAAALVRSLAWAIAIVLASNGLNRLGFHVKL